MDTREFGNYQIKEAIGRGGMGVVYRAVQVSLNRAVAIKTLPAEARQHPEFIERLKKEANILAQLQHPNIVYIFDIIHESDQDVLVMEYIAGYTLAQLLKKQPGGRFDPQKARTIIRDVSSALSHAHRHNVIHRDIKPANIMITHDGVVKVTDFGVARLTSGVKMTRTGMITGTPHYMSPEQIRGDKDIDGRSDIYSLGIVFYEMLTGRTPFTGHSEYDIMVKQVQEVPVRPTEAAGDRSLIDDEAIILKCIAKDRADRYQSADQLINDLNAIPAEGQKPFVLSEGHGYEEEATRIVRPPHKAKRMRLFGLAIVAVLIAAAGIVYFLSGPGQKVEHGQKVIADQPATPKKAPAKLALPQQTSERMPDQSPIPQVSKSEFHRKLDGLQGLSPQELVRRHFRLKTRFEASTADASETVARISTSFETSPRVQATTSDDYDLYFLISRNNSSLGVRYLSPVHGVSKNGAAQANLYFSSDQAMVDTIEAMLNREYCFKILRNLSNRNRNPTDYKLDLTIGGGRDGPLRVGEKIDICMAAGKMSYGLLLGVDLAGIYLIPPRPGKVMAEIDRAGTACVRNIEVAAATGTEMVFALGSVEKKILDDLLSKINQPAGAYEWSYNGSEDTDALSICEHIYLALTQKQDQPWSAQTRFIRTQR